MVEMLPRLFFDHFRDTSFVAEDSEGDIVAFVVAFVSPHRPSLGYVHFIGVRPDRRGSGLGTQAYRRCFDVLMSRGCREVAAVTSPVNTASLAFHRALGFTVGPTIDDYDGPGEGRVLLSLALPAAEAG